jgi:hypothetical protein
MMTGGGANCQLKALIEVLAPFTCPRHELPSQRARCGGRRTHTGLVGQLPRVGVICQPLLVEPADQSSGIRAVLSDRFVGHELVQVVGNDRNGVTARGPSSLRRWLAAHPTTIVAVPATASTEELGRSPEKAAWCSASDGAHPLLGGWRKLRYRAPATALRAAGRSLVQVKMGRRVNGPFTSTRSDSRACTLQERWSVGQVIWERDRLPHLGALN